jgi:hypothetical protein
MTASELQAPLLELLRQISTNIWLVAVFALVGAGVGAFGGAYLRKRGEDRATQENFTAIREQLKTTTRDTEEIKQQLSGRGWRSQQQWSAREQYYSKLLTHLHHFRMALDDLSDYYLEPGTEYMPDDQRDEPFHKLRADASSAYTEVQKLLGPAAIFLSPKAVESLNELFTEHWGLANFGAVCTADYVGSAVKLATVAYEQVLHEAKAHLDI